jgi:hypothetical protein
LKKYGRVSRATSLSYICSCYTTRITPIRPIAMVPILSSRPLEAVPPGKLLAFISNTFRIILSLGVLPVVCTLQKTLLSGPVAGIKGFIPILCYETSTQSTCNTLHLHKPCQVYQYVRAIDAAYDAVLMFHMPTFVVLRSVPELVFTIHIRIAARVHRQNPHNFYGEMAERSKAPD